MYPVDPRTLSHLQHLTISPGFAGGVQLGLAAGRVVGIPFPLKEDGISAVVTNKYRISDRFRSAAAAV